MNIKKIYKKLFASTFKISAFTVGGGFVIVSLMKKRFVEELNWIEEAEMLDLITIAQLSPGAIAINASVLVGYRVAGIVGAIIAVLGTILPPLIINSIISLFYHFFSDNVIANMVMTGILCGVSAVIFDVVINMVRKIFEQKRIFYIIVLIGAFVATYLFSINIILIIVLCGTMGAVETWYRNNKAKDCAQK